MQISLCFDVERSAIVLIRFKPDKQVTFRSNSGFFLGFQFQSGFQKQVFSLFEFTANRFLQYYTNRII